MKLHLGIAVAVAVAVAGCGDDSCNEESMDVLQETVPACSDLAPGPVTVSFQVCATCNHIATSCTVDRQGSTVQLDPLAEACESASSCPLPSCGLNGADRRTITCSFVAAPTDTQILVFDGGSGQPITRDISVTGSATSCGIAGI